jgi:thiamine biosynthesis lipoprotein
MTFAPESRLRHAEHVMGTVVSFDVPARAREDESLAAAIRWLHWVDATFSTFKPDSDVSRLGRGEVALADCAPEVAEVLAACDQLGAEAGGYFTAYPQGSLDPSGYVKGWAIEHAAAIISAGPASAAGPVAHTVNGGGDVQCVGSNPAGPPGPGGTPAGSPWRVGIANPFLPGTLARVVAGRDFAVATSGTAERGAHIMDPVAGRPAAGLASITIVGPSLTLADARATAAFAMGPRLAREWTRDAIDGYEAYAILPDGSTWTTAGFACYAAGP